MSQVHSMTVERLIQKTCEYLSVPSVVGFEQPFLKHLANDFRGLGFECEFNPRFLLVGHPSAHSDVMLSVHVDRHGLITTSQHELEYAAFVMRAEKYQVFPSASLAMLNRIRQRFIGEQVYAYRPETGEVVGSAAIEDAFFSPERENMIFRAPELDTCTERLPVSYGAKCDWRSESLRGQLDNAISAALAYEICRSGFEGRVLFTCEEEIGRSWQAIQTVLERDRLDHVKLIVLDTSPFDTEEQESLDFVILRHRDAHSLFDPYLTEALETCARSAKIPFVYKDRWLERQPRDKPLVSYGSTELGRLIKETAGRWNGTTLQIPTIGYHTNRETASFKAIENFWLLLTTFLLDH